MTSPREKALEAALHVAERCIAWGLREPAIGELMPCCGVDEAGEAIRAALALPADPAPDVTGSTTPGPWRLGESSGFPSQFTIQGADGRIVAEWTFSRIYEESSRLDSANGRLMAAAPDMLAALQFAFRCWECGAWKNEDGETPDIEPIRAALARATSQEG